MFHALVGDNKLFNRAEIESGDAGALPCAPSLPIRPEKIGQIWSRYYRGQAISNKAGDPQGHLERSRSVVGKGSLRDPVP